MNTALIIAIIIFLLVVATAAMAYAICADNKYKKEKAKVQVLRSNLNAIEFEGITCRKKLDMLTARIVTVSDTRKKGNPVLSLQNELKQYLYFEGDQVKVDVLKNAGQED